MEINQIHTLFSILIYFMTKAVLVVSFSLSFQQLGLPRSMPSFVHAVSCSCSKLMSNTRRLYPKSIIVKNYVVYLRVSAEKVLRKELLFLKYLLTKHATKSHFFLSRFVISNIQNAFITCEFFYHSDLFI